MQKKDGNVGRTLEGEFSEKILSIFCWLSHLFCEICQLKIPELIFVFLLFNWFGQTESSMNFHQNLIEISLKFHSTTRASTLPSLTTSLLTWKRTNKVRSHSKRTPLYQLELPSPRERRWSTTQIFPPKFYLNFETNLWWDFTEIF